jgi:hypothetical protein
MGRRERERETKRGNDSFIGSFLNEDVRKFKEKSYSEKKI